MMLANSWFVTLIKMKPSWEQTWRPVCHLSSCWKKLWPEVDNEVGWGEGVGWHTEYPLVSHWSSRIPTGRSWRSWCGVNWEGAWTNDSTLWTRRWWHCCWEAWADCLCCEGMPKLTACAVKAQLSWLHVLWRKASSVKWLELVTSCEVWHFMDQCLRLMQKVEAVTAPHKELHWHAQEGTAVQITSLFHSLVSPPSSCCPFCSIILMNLSQEFWCYPNKYKH